MKRSTLVLSLLLILGIAWASIWWHFARPAAAAQTNVPALFIILAIGVTAFVAIPCVIFKGLLRKRWLLILMLVFVNIFWCIKWIDIYRTTPPDDPPYAAVRPLLWAAMFLSGILVFALYWLIGRIITAIEKQR